MDQAEVEERLDEFVYQAESQKTYMMLMIRLRARKRRWVEHQAERQKKLNEVEARLGS